MSIDVSGGEVPGLIRLWLHSIVNESAQLIAISLERARPGDYDLNPKLCGISRLGLTPHQSLNMTCRPSMQEGGLEELSSPVAVYYPRLSCLAYQQGDQSAELRSTHVSYPLQLL